MNAILKIAVGSIASLLLAGTAMAADLMAPPPPEAAMTSSSDWTGGYLGLGLSYRTVSPVSIPKYTDTVVSAILGANLQSGMFLVGLEGRLEYSYENDNAFQQWEMAVKGRAGIAVGDAALLYGALGYEYRPVTGYAYYQMGLGVEFMVTDNVSLDFEYLHSIPGNSSTSTTLDDVTAAVLWHFK